MAICCTNIFSFAKEMNVTKLIANLMAFSPPSKPEYTIIEDLDLNERGACYRKVNFIHSEFKEISYPWIESEAYLLKKCSNRKRIVLLYIKNKCVKKENKTTIIFSHGNSCDLGVIYPILIDLSTQLKADVISYDYSGYGRSEGSTSEKELYTDIEQVMDFVTIFKGVKQDKIILMGNSLGSVPSVHISVHPAYHNIKGVILLSPIASGIKLINPKLTMQATDLEKIDVFCNLSKVSEINCPVLLIHGMEDNVIPYSQSLEMMNKMKSVYEWFPARGTHSNIMSRYRTKFFMKIKLFLDHLYYNQLRSTKANTIEIEEIVNDRVQGVNPIFKPKIKSIRTEENYIFCNNNTNVYNQNVNNQRFSPIRLSVIDENGSASNDYKKSYPEKNCVSVTKPNLFYDNTNECPFDGQIRPSVEIEGEYIFSNNRMSETNYNIQDAKELEYEFNKIQKL